jgi:SAM-dependent methyltransferase
MSERIIGLDDWLNTPAGCYLLDWERRQFDASVADIFGYHALQLGLPQIDALGANRMPHRWIVADRLGASPGSALVGDFTGLPFSSGSIDLVVLPHTLEFHPDPHATLREVERVLVPEGKVVICGLNPASLWGLRQQRGHFYRRFGWGQLFLPDAGEFIGYWRLRDWLRLLSFEVESGRFGCYRPALRGEDWLRRYAWMDRAGSRWWPIFGAAYFVVAVKRVRGMKLLGAAWRVAKAGTGSPVSVANGVRKAGRKDGFG